MSDGTLIPVQKVAQKHFLTRNLTSSQSFGWILVLLMVPTVLGYGVTNFLFSITAFDLENVGIRVVLANTIISAFFTALIINHLLKLDPQIICKNVISSRKIVGISLVLLAIIISFRVLSHELNIEKSDFLSGVNSSALNIFLGFVAICIIAPVFEELIFRGVFFSFLLNLKVNKFLVLITSSLVFTFIHAQYGAAELTYVFVLAIFFGLVRLNTKNIFLCMALHGANNVYAFLNYLITH